MACTAARQAPGMHHPPPTCVRAAFCRSISCLCASTMPELKTPCLDGGDDVRQPALPAGEPSGGPHHLEVVFWLHGAGLLRQVPHMAVRRQHLSCVLTFSSIDRQHVDRVLAGRGEGLPTGQDAN